MSVEKDIRMKIWTEGCSLWTSYFTKGWTSPLVLAILSIYINSVKFKDSFKGRNGKQLTRRDSSVISIYRKQMENRYSSSVEFFSSSHQLQICSWNRDVDLQLPEWEVRALPAALAFRAAFPDRVTHHLTHRPGSMAPTYGASGKDQGLSNGGQKYLIC